MHLLQCIETSTKLECALNKLKQRDLNDMSVQVNLLDNTEQMDDDSLVAKSLKIKVSYCTLKFDMYPL